MNFEISLGGCFIYKNYTGKTEDMKIFVYHDENCIECHANDIPVVIRCKEKIWKWLPRKSKIELTH